MVSTLILTHGGLARELLASARVIVGEMADFEALSLDWNEKIESVEAKVRAAVDRIDRGDGVLILTDMFGGTPCNIAARFRQPGRVEIVSGVNLPMVLRLGCRMDRDDNRDLSEIADWLQDKGRQSVRRLTEPGSDAAETDAECEE